MPARQPAGARIAVPGHVFSQTIKKGVMLLHNSLIFLVGMARFERAASASRTLRSSQTEPHPVAKKNLAQSGENGKRFFHLSIFFICGRFFSLSDELL